MQETTGPRWTMRRMARPWAEQPSPAPQARSGQWRAMTWTARCRRTELFNSAKGLSGNSQFDYCRQADGAWKSPPRHGRRPRTDGRSALRPCVTHSAQMRFAEKRRCSHLGQAADGYAETRTPGARRCRGGAPALGADHQLHPAVIELVDQEDEAGVRSSREPPMIGISEMNTVWRVRASSM